MIQWVLLVLLCLSQQLGQDSLTSFKSENMFNDDETVSYIRNAIRLSVREALAPSITAMTERQDAIETRIRKQLESIRTAITPTQESHSESTQEVTSSSSSKPYFTPKTKEIFSCYLCTKTFGNINEFDLHIQSTHPSLICKPCGKNLRSIPDLNYHNHKYHTQATEVPSHQSQSSVQLIPVLSKNPSPPENSNDPCCWVCGFVSKRWDDLRIHIDTKHSTQAGISKCAMNPSSPFKEGNSSLHDNLYCYLCGKVFKLDSEIAAHMTTDHQDVLLPSQLRYCMLDTETQNQVCACSKCDLLFNNTNELILHLEFVHGESSQYVCSVCSHIFRSKEDLSIHLHSVHSQADIIHCKFCDSTFGGMRQLNKHTISMHVDHPACHLAEDITSTPSKTSSSYYTSQKGHGDITKEKVQYHCYQCDYDCFGTENMIIHEKDHDTDTASINSPLSCIPQIDGNLSIASSVHEDPGINPNLSHAMIHVQSHHPSVQPEQQPPTQQGVPQPAQTFHEAPYFLNRKKQSDKVCKDASKDNMEVTANNNNTNVNIQCSSGFYLVVARPCVASFTQGSTSQLSAIQIICREEFNQVDKSGAPDFTRLSFELKDNGQSVLGKVVLHLHHTTRLVQVQGSAKMPDKTTAAVWFAEQFLTKKFQELAKTRQFDISAFNKGILEMSRQHHNSVRSDKFCAECNKLFSQSSKPISCPSCQRKIHTGCLRPHLSLCSNAVENIEETPSTSSPTRLTKRTRTSSSSAITTTRPATRCSNPPAFLNSLTAGLITSGIPTFTGRRTLVSFVPPVSTFSLTSQDSSSTTVLENSSQPIFSNAAFSTSTSTVSSQPISEPSSLHTVTPVTSAGLGRPAKKASSITTNKTKTKPRQEPSSENDQISFLTTELNFAHTRIVTQDNTIKDLEYKVKILRESLRLSEEKLNNDLHKKYFGATASSSSYCCGSQPPSNHSCYTTACPSPRPRPCSCTGGSPTLPSIIPAQSHHPPSSNSSQLSETNTIDERALKTNFDNIVSEMNQMKIDIFNIKSRLKSILVPTDSSTSPNSKVTSEPEINQIADVLLNTDHDVTIASLDEDITDTEQNPCAALENPTNQSN